MNPEQFETRTVVRELIDTLRDLDQRFFDGPNALEDELQVLEGYRWMFSMLRVALDTQVWADPANPRFVEIVGPYKKWGGDNSDAYYQHAPIDPDRTYRVRGTRGDAVYLSLSVYGGPNDGRYSERIVGSVNDRDDLEFGPDGEFEFVMARERPEGWDGTFIALEDDAVVAITRDYLDDPVNGKRCEWHITADDIPPTWRETDAQLAQKFRHAMTWLGQQADMVPLGFGELNQIDEPYPVRPVTFGWGAGDAAYAMGSFDLADDQALVIRGTSPESAFWNCCLWNQFMHTYNYDYEQVTLNGSQIVLESDGSWTLVVAHTDPGHPNWISTAGHPRGRVWFRWFYPAETPVRPTTEVVALDAVPAAP